MTMILRNIFSKLSSSESLRNSSPASQRKRGTHQILKDDEAEDMISGSTRSSRRSSLSTSAPQSIDTSSDSRTTTLRVSCSEPANPNEPDHHTGAINKKLSESSSLIVTMLKAPVGDHSQGIPMALLKCQEKIIIVTSKSMLKVISCTSTELLAPLSFRCSSSPVRSLQVIGDLIYTSHDDLKIRIWKTRRDASQEKLVLIATLPTLWHSIISSMLPDPESHIKRTRRSMRSALGIHHRDAISALALSPDRALLYSGSWDRTIKAWRTRDFRCVDSFQAHSDAVNHLLVSSHIGDAGYYLYSASSDGGLKVWERVLHTRKNDKKHILTASFNRHQAGVNALALSRDEQHLYSGSGDKSVIVWEREDSADHMSMRQVLRGHRGSVLCLGVGVSSSECVLCSGSADGTVRVWQKRIQPEEEQLQHCWSCMAILRESVGTPVKSIVVVSEQRLNNGFRVYARCLGGNLKAWWIEEQAEDCDKKIKFQGDLSHGHEEK